MKQNKVIYFSKDDEEVIRFKNKKKEIDKNYKYIHTNIFYNIFAFLSYHFVAKPIVWFCFKFIRKVKYKNTKILKPFKKQGFFIYGNHVDQFSDGLSPALIFYPKTPKLIVHSSNLSMPLIGKFTPMWGALPLPDTIEATKNFYKAIEHNLSKNTPIMIYPEAHLWPYYTGIRNFSSISFRFPIKYNKPVFTYTTTFHKRKLSKNPRLEIYIDGPFFPDYSLDDKKNQQKLRNLCYNIMVERSKLNSYEYVKYKKEEK